MEAGGLSLRRVSEQRLGHDGERATQPGEAALLGEAAELNGALASAGDFIDRVGNARLRDVGLISGIVKDERPVLQRVSYPPGELFPSGDRTSGVVRITKIN